MDNTFVFHPDRLVGLVIHSVMIILLFAVGVLGVYMLIQTTVSPIFFLYLIPVLLAIGFAPVVAYRAYALYRAVYVLDRDGIQLRWGLRAEDIPLDLVDWVGPIEKFALAMPVPRLNWLGSIGRIQTLPDGRKIEFMAANTSHLVLISTPRHVYGISPQDPDHFLETYRQFAELGSLDPIPARSVYPSLFLTQVWRARPARYLILVGLALSLILFMWVSFIIPTRAEIPFGFRPDGTHADLVPSRQLLLFPIANGIFFLADVILGLFFFRRSLNSEGPSNSGYRADQIMAYLLWVNGVFIPFLFIIAVFFILQA